MITDVAPAGRTIADVRHHLASVNGTTLHYVSAGSTGSPILLVHGFPETWWAFHRLIPLLATNHRVFAVDLRGFGDSSVADDNLTSTDVANDVHALVSELGLGPVHLFGQDISGGAVYRFAASHPEHVRSLVATEMGLAGFGLEAFGDVTRGGSWHIGVLAHPEVTRMLFTGREHELMSQWAFPSMTAVAGAITSEDIDEFARSYARPNGWNGAVGLYRSMLREGADLQALAATPLTLPALAIGGFGGPFTAATLTQVVDGPVQSAQMDGVGHYVALEAPERLAATVLPFLANADRNANATPA